MHNISFRTVVLEPHARVGEPKNHLGDEGKPLPEKKRERESELIIMSFAFHKKTNTN